MTDPIENPQPIRLADLLWNQGKAYLPYETDLYQGFTEIKLKALPQGTPDFHWKGAKIPYALWCQCMDFLVWSQLQHKEESLLWLFYHRQSREWAAWAPPQRPQGMTVKSLPEFPGKDLETENPHPGFEDQRANWGKGWALMGTIHHHCTGAAHQSGTDKQDETTKDGIHITIGKIGQEMLDYHGRAVFDGIQTNALLSNWVETPDWFKTIPGPVITLMWPAVLLSAPLVSPTKGREDRVPELWKRNIISFTYWNDWRANHRPDVVTNPPAQVLGNSQHNERWRQGNLSLVDEKKTTVPSTKISAMPSGNTTTPSVPDSRNGKTDPELTTLTPAEKRAIDRILTACNTYGFNTYWELCYPASMPFERMARELGKREAKRLKNRYDGVIRLVLKGDSAFRDDEEIFQFVDETMAFVGAWPESFFEWDNEKIEEPEVVTS